MFATIGKSGRSITAKAEAIGRLVSLCFRSGVAVRDVVAQLKGIGGEHPVFQKKGMRFPFPTPSPGCWKTATSRGRLRRLPIPTRICRTLPAPNAARK